ncbi:MAG: DinB family protein [Thermocrispum sp.]
MTQPRDRINAVFAASEREQLETFLDYLRDAVVRKARGVSEEDARRSPVASGTNLGGLVKHLRWVEQSWFAHGIAQIPDDELPTPPWTDDDPDADLRLETGEELGDVIDAYLAQCERSRELAAKYDLDYAVTTRRGRQLTLRWVYLHMIEETGRHAGHADILREQIDGAAGD